MKKILFGLLTFLFCFNIAYAHVEDVQFVGGTGGSKILELNVEDNKVDTSGVIYDRNASLVYEITYTNVSDLDKKINDVILPSADILLSYDISELEKEKVIKPGETVKFQYSIKALDDVTEEQLLTLNENAQAKLVLSSVEVANPGTFDAFFIIITILILCISLYKFTKDKRMFYSCFIICLVSVIFSYSKNVVAGDVEVVNLDTNVKFIFSNLAPSCANLDYEGDFCIDWKQYGNRDLVHYLVMEDSKEMSDTYTIGDVSFSLENTYDVSEQQNGDVVLGIYKAQVEEESYLFLVGQDEGVIVPKDSSYQFSSYDSVNNNSENDFKYVKYADFSKFFSNKTTNMEYMLTGVGTRVDMEFSDLSGFETSNVTNMKGMFAGFGEFTKNLVIDVSMFDTSNVTDMSWMFWEVGYESESVTLDLSTFDTGKVTDMSYMFYNFAGYANEVDLNIYDLDTSKVENMSYMFTFFRYYSNEDFTIDYFKKWDTNNLKNVSYMFSRGFYYGGDGKIIVDLTGLDTNNVTNMKNMFWLNIRVSEIIGLETLDTSNVDNMSGLFAFTDAKYLNVSDWDVSNVKDMSYMFANINYYGVNELADLNLKKWDVSSVENFSGMFLGLKNNVFISGWNVGLGQNFSSMFGGYNGEKLDLSGINFVNATAYVNMFSINSDKASYSVIDLSDSDWNQSATTDGMFKNLTDVTIYVKDEKAKAFIEKQAPDCTVLIKE